MDFKELLKQKGEIIAISASGLILLGYVVVAFGLSSSAEVSAVEQDTAAAEQMLGSNPAPELPRPDFSPSLAVWAPGSVAKAEGKGGWVAMFKPTVRPNVKKSEKPVVPVEVPKHLLTPVISPTETELGQVTIKWAEGKKAGVPVAAISEWIVERQEAGKPEWTLLEKVPGLRKTCVDKGVEPKKKYSYRVKGATKDKTVDGKTETGYTATVEATIPSGVAIVFAGGSSTGAQITVRKFMGGDWKEKKFTVFPKNEDKGQKGEIGRKEKERDADSGKMVDVDYTTGFILLEIKKEKYKYKRKVKKSEIKDGVLETTEVEEDAEKDRYKIVYTDDEGKQKEMWMAEKDEEGGE